MGYVEEMRQAIGSRPIIRPGVRAIIRNEEGSVLLQLRGDFHIWGLPAGGMEIGETVVEAMRREVFEETGLTVLRARPFGIYSNPAYTITYPNGDQAQPYATGFLVDEWTGTLTVDGDETLELRWFPLDSLPPPEQILPAHRRVFGDLQRFLNSGEFTVD
ncbi:MAG: NUDIX hydrolase [Chloroflexi bacterium]|nr:NUDIX hydrolase [Chloroflexota bacterium]